MQFNLKKMLISSSLISQLKRICRINLTYYSLRFFKTKKEMLVFPEMSFTQLYYNLVALLTESKGQFSLNWIKDNKSSGVTTALEQIFSTKKMCVANFYAIFPLYSDQANKNEFPYIMNFFFFQVSFEKNLSIAYLLITKTTKLR